MRRPPPLSHLYIIDEHLEARIARLEPTTRISFAKGQRAERTYSLKNEYGSVIWAPAINGVSYVNAVVCNARHNQLPVVPIPKLTLRMIFSVLSLYSEPGGVR